MALNCLNISKSFMVLGEKRGYSPTPAEKASGNITEQKTNQLFSVFIDMFPFCFSFMMTLLF